jgi:alkylation response protein AidB-like acyl-CoA dehydrogenase
MMADKNLLISTEKKLIREIQAFADEYQNNNQVSFYKIWSHLMETGFHRLLADTCFGGSGTGLKDYVNIIRLLASADGSVALATHIHNLAVKIVSEFINVHLQKQLTKWLDEGTIFALARSEFQRDYRYDFATRIFQDGSTFILNGQKDFCTLAGLADHYVVFAQTDIVNPSMDTLQLCIVNGKDPRVEVIKENGLDSMVASSTYSIRFNQCELDQSQMVGQPGDIKRLTNPDTLTLGICAINLGIVDRVLDLFKNKIKKYPDKIDNREIFRWLGQVDVMLSGTELLLDKSINSRPELDKESGTWLRRAKASCDILVNEVTEGAIRYSGIEGIMSKNKFVYLRNDSRAAQVMSPSSYKSLTSLGEKMMEN